MKTAWLIMTRLGPEGRAKATGDVYILIGKRRRKQNVK